jgi:hypothetical protein
LPVVGVNGHYRATGCLWVWPSSRLALHPGQAQGPRIHSTPPPVPTGRGRTSVPVLVVNVHYRGSREGILLLPPLVGKYTHQTRKGQVQMH